MNIIEVAREALGLYHDGDFHEANRVLSKLHVEVYEGTTVIRDTPMDQAHDLNHIINQDFPFSATPTLTPEQVRVVTVFMATAKAIGSLLSDYLME